MPDLDAAIQDRIARFQPATAPEFGVVRARRRRRATVRVLATTVVVGGVAAVAIPYAMASKPDSVLVSAPAPSHSPTAVPASPGWKQKPDARDRAAEKLWKSKAANKYIITLTVTCFCPGGGVPHEIFVEGGTPEPGPPDRGPSVVSVEALFHMINNGEGERYTVTYDPVYGYPRQVEFDKVINAVDDEITYTVTDYRVQK